MSEPVAAQDGFALNRFEPSESGSRWIAADSLDISGHMRPSFGLVSDWAHKPLVAYAANGNEAGVLARDQLFLHMRASMNFTDRVRVGVTAPMLVYQDGSDLVIGGEEYRIEQEASIGDVRLSGDVRVFGRHDDSVTLATGVVVYLPTGSADHFAGENAMRFQPRVQVAGEIGAFVYAARTGVHIRTEPKTFASESVGSELTAGAAAGVQFLDRKLLVGPVLVGSTVISEGSSGFLDRQTTPFEMQIGAHYDATPELRFAGGVGPGLSRGVGAPASRWVLAAEWSPRPEDPMPVALLPADTDGDGVIDGVDACPTVAGVSSSDTATTGCPLSPPDRDGDTIANAEDACPGEAGNAAPQDSSRHGCPVPADRDGDGISDPQDACPTDAGVENLSDGARHGCPLPVDRDSDGVLDEADACPRDAGIASDDVSRNGCPRAIVTADKIQILDRIEFESGRANLRPEADEILGAVAAALLAHPEVTELSVEGHTDSSGRVETNRELSSRRAAAVVRWLIQKGVARERLVSRGWGPDQPLESNDSPEGRRNNRRVEFRVLGMNGKPISGADARVEGAP